MLSTASLIAPAKAYDPALASLFTSSSGPVKLPEKSIRDSALVLAVAEAVDEGDTSSEESLSYEVDNLPSSDNEEVDDDDERPRKRKRVVDDDLEASYFRKLAKEDEREQPLNNLHEAPLLDDTTSEGSSEPQLEVPHEEIPVHESLTKEGSVVDKNSRTVFLSNVSTDAVKSKSTRKKLLDYLESVLAKPDESDPTTKIESIRFRSTPYASGVGLKRAAFAKKELKDDTTKSTNAYVVFSTQQDARRVVSKLNGIIILDRHLGVDNLASPRDIDHKRCVFVGNLPFVDVESTEDKDENEQIKQRRALGKQPADPEEGLWRTFSKVGKVENVRVVRDKETRVSKGFAYVQFTDPNGVEAALVLDGKRFPPMLPRTLRVSRAKRERPKSRPQNSGDSQSGSRTGTRQDKALRDSGAFVHKAAASGANNATRGIPLERFKFIFEGHRASSQSQKGTGIKERSAKPKSRSARRGASFKASGGKKKREGK